MAKKPQVQSFDDSETKDAVRPHHTTNTLKLKIDNLKTFGPLTPNQKKFFDGYSQGDYFVALLGSAGTGKCIGQDELVDLFVTDELYDRLIEIDKK